MKHSVLKKSVLIAALSIGLSNIGLAEDQTMSTDNQTTYQVYLPNQMQWAEGPAALPKGVKMAVLEGNPKNEGPFTIRLKFPANYQIPLHWHPETERITVISGTLYLGISDKVDKKIAKPLTAGSFAYMQPKTTHFAFTQRPTIVQLNGVGPWSVHFVE